MSSKNTADVLDCSRPLTWLFWFVVGIGFAVGLMAVQRTANWASLLRVGSSNPALPQIERELGPIVSPNAVGHDGQLYYLIARDPFARAGTVGVLSAFDTNPPRYRYRRILFPLLTGGFGLFSGRTTLFAMVLLVAVGMGLAMVASADLSFQLGLPGGAAFLAAVNIGAFVSAMILTADALAFGLSSAGVALAARRRVWWAIAAFMLAGLTKEIYLLVPMSIAAWQWHERQRWAAVEVAVLPVLPVAVWAAWVSTIVPEAPMTQTPFGLPMVGLVRSVSRWMLWHGDNPLELMVAAYVILSVISASVMLAVGYNTRLRWILAPWLILAFCSTEVAVWDIPSNVARQFPILWSLSMLLIVEWFSVRRQRASKVRQM